MASKPETPPYPHVASQPELAAAEREVLARWAKDDTFRRSVAARPGGKNEYVFYDGPPFANGLPHYGHLLTGYVKDVVPRYQTMKGRRVERRFGWDCHGLPAEMESEKELGISGRQAIEAYGIEKFNAHCRESVLKYTHEWEKTVTRQARWVDFQNDYKTMDLSYMESVIWAFKELWKKGLIYQGHRVMPYSWAAETPLSNFEVRMDNSYRPRQDPAVTVKFRLAPAPDDAVPTSILVWTTTPWTLPSNLALAVGPEIEYAVYELSHPHALTIEEGPSKEVPPLPLVGESREERLIVGLATVGAFAKELEGWSQVGTVKGAELVGRTYSPMFGFFKDHAQSFRVLGADFVDTAEGTGTVHLAPGFGEDDQRVCEAAGIELVCPVDEKGRFTAEVPDWQGQNVLEANKPIIQRLKQDGVLFKHATYEHNYPHCWRTDQPLIYKALSSWYVRVTDFKARMVELNQEIHWIPDRIRDGQFGKWLENARDWSISRNRFWGTPIPVWQSDDPSYPRTDVYGSLEEIAKDFGVLPTDLHRPFVDDLVRPNPDDPSGKSMMRRVPEVLDCWFESGSMPFAQVHYPFENKDWFESHFPADFIVEYIGQTRGWFYTLMVLGTALFDKPPFRNCICHGIVLDENGQKLSKKLRNYPDPTEVCETYGADALRWFLISSPILRGGDLQIDREGKGIADVVRLVEAPIHNAYAFFTLYANSDGVRARFRADSKELLDRYLLAKTRDLVSSVEAALDAYDIAGACQVTTEFLDAMNNWYIRRSRGRFWRHDAHVGDAARADQDKRDAYDTLYSVLVTVCKVTAPLLPLLAETVYRGLTGAESVHLADWPDANAFPAEPELVRVMDRARDVCSVALSLRDAHKLRTRLPLASLTIAGKGNEGLGAYTDLIRDEVNVKEVRLSENADELGTFELLVNARAVGKKLGADMKAVMDASKTGNWKMLADGRAEVGPRVLEADEFSMRLRSREGMASSALPSNDAVVGLDTNVTPELEQEGVARDLVRLVQQARKEADFQITDRIRIFADVPDEALSAIETHRSYVLEQTLGDRLEFAAIPAGVRVEEGKIGKSAVKVGVERS